MPETYELRPIGRISSSLRSLDQAPRQGAEGAPDAWLELDPAAARGIDDLAVGEKIVIVTWLHLADRSVLATVSRSARVGSFV